ncbi:MAG TPA: Rdx family protein [Candidatus Dormibacteraeota bacterium]|nr:Rdx family protein [Candidatus Dormibacteraeota bacterium]
MEQAVGLAAEILGAWAPIMIDVSLRSGSKGRFEVSLDERLLFSKAKLKRFPKAGEILALAEPTLGPPIAWR